MSNQPQFSGGIDVVPGAQGGPVATGGFRLVTIAGAPYTTTDGITFTAVASTAAATPSAAGLMPAVGASGGTVQQFYTGVIDLTQTGIVTIIPPTPLRFRQLAISFEIKTTTGASVSPTFQVGADSAISNYAASQTVAGLASGAAESIQSAAGATPAAQDLTTNGMRISVTAGATATALTARVFTYGILLPV